MSSIKFEWINESNEKTLPLDCPVCHNMIVTVEDVNSLREKECCADCNITYYYPNKEKWDKGWRPDIVRD